MTVEHIVDNPVPRPVGAGGLQGLPVDRVQQRFRSRSPSFPIPVEAVSQSASSSDSPGQAGEGFFRTFPHRKKSAKIPRTQGSELGAESSSWTP